MSLKSQSAETKPAHNQNHRTAKTDKTLNWIITKRKHVKSIKNLETIQLVLAKECSTQKKP